MTKLLTCRYRSLAAQSCGALLRLAVCYSQGIPPTPQHFDFAWAVQEAGDQPEEMQGIEVSGEVLKSLS